MQERKREPKRKTQKDFIKSKSPRMGTVYDTVAFKNYQAERISRLMSTGPTGDKTFSYFVSIILIISALVQLLKLCNKKSN